MEYSVSIVHKLNFKLSGLTVSAFVNCGIIGMSRSTSPGPEHLGVPCFCVIVYLENFIITVVFVPLTLRDV